MKSIFDNTTRNGLINRIKSLNPSSKAQWGKMNLYQMLRHCSLCEELYLGKIKVERSFLGRIFGKMGLNNLLKDEKPLKKNSPTSSHFKVKAASGDVEAEKQKWIQLIEEYANFSNTEFVHWFFGKMTKEQVGQFVYKHTDHHLRQFNG
jgi:hypothetical protein